MTLTKFGCIWYFFISANSDNASSKFSFSTQTYEPKDKLHQHLGQIKNAILQLIKHRWEEQWLQNKINSESGKLLNLDSCCICNNIRFHPSCTHIFQNLHWNKTLLMFSLNLHVHQDFVQWHQEKVEPKTQNYVNL